MIFDQFAIPFVGELKVVDVRFGIAELLQRYAVHVQRCDYERVLERDHARVLRLFLESREREREGENGKNWER